MSETTNPMTPEMEALKKRLKTTWEAGDYGHFAKYLERGALEFLERLKIPPRARMLDLGCGAGQLTIPAAKKGHEVTGVDLAQNLVDQANERIKAEGVNATVMQGDAEDLPFPNARFDVVLSLIGAMFAPRPELVASEMVRVCRPGGHVIMGNWTPASHVGQMFKLVGKYAPPPPIFPSPLQWGIREKIEERFGDRLEDLQITHHMYPMEYPFSPPEVADFFIQFYGPTNKMFSSLQPEEQVAFRNEFANLWTSNNTLKNGNTLVLSEYVEVVGIVRS